MPAPTVNLLADLRATHGFVQAAASADMGERMSRALIGRWRQQASTLSPAIIAELQGELAVGPWSAAIKLELEQFLAEMLIASVGGELLLRSTMFSMPAFPKLRAHRLADLLLTQCFTRTARPDHR